MARNEEHPKKLPSTWRFSDKGRGGLYSPGPLKRESDTGFWKTTGSPFTCLCRSKNNRGELQKIALIFTPGMCLLILLPKFFFSINEWFKIPWCERHGVYASETEEIDPRSTQMAYLSQTLCNTRQLKIEKKPIYCTWGQKKKTEKGPVFQSSLSVLSPWVHLRLKEPGLQLTW